MKYIGYYATAMDAQTECTLLTRATGIQAYWYEQYGAYHVVQNPFKRPKRIWGWDKREVKP